MAKYSLSVVIVTYKRLDLLKRCLNSILVTNDEIINEIFIVVNGDDKETIVYLESINSNVIIISVLKCTPGKARNYALRNVSNDWVFFIDDDAYLGECYLTKIKKYLHLYGDIYDVLGGPDTSPPSSNYFQKSLGLALISPLATWRTRYRHFPKKSHRIIETTEKMLTLCNLLVKTNVFKKNNFDENIVRNEENILLINCYKQGLKLGYIQDLFVYHSRRKSFYELSGPVFYSGYCRASLLNIMELNDALVFLLPFFFLIYVLLLLVIIPVSVMYYLPLISYIVLSFYFALSLCDYIFKLNQVMLIMFLQWYILVNYGLGQFYFFIKKIFNSRLLLKTISGMK